MESMLGFCMLAATQTECLSCNSEIKLTFLFLRGINLLGQFATDVFCVVTFTSVWAT